MKKTARNQHRLDSLACGQVEIEQQGKEQEEAGDLGVKLPSVLEGQCAYIGDVGHDGAVVGVLARLRRRTTVAGSRSSPRWRSAEEIGFADVESLVEECGAGLGQGRTFTSKFAGSLVDGRSFRGGLGTGPVDGEEQVDVWVASEVSDDGADGADMELEPLGELIGCCVFVEVGAADLIVALAGEWGCWNRRASSWERAIAVGSQMRQVVGPRGTSWEGFHPGGRRKAMCEKSKNGRGSGRRNLRRGNEGEGKEARMVADRGQLAEMESTACGPQKLSEPGITVRSTEDNWVRKRQVQRLRKSNQLHTPPPLNKQAKFFRLCDLLFLTSYDSAVQISLTAENHSVCRCSPGCSTSQDPASYLAGMDVNPCTAGTIWLVLPQDALDQDWCRQPGC